MAIQSLPMTNSVFLDTNGWLALLNSTDGLHAEADRVWRELGSLCSRVMLTDWILAETGNGLARTQARGCFVKAVQLISQSSRTELVYIDKSIADRALAMYQHHLDKSWGLVDCASFVVMKENNISQALTSDRHFEQAGFRCLLSS